MARTVELATILLTDLVASTSTAARLGPERADRLRDDYFAVLRDAFHRYGGREFKNSGDGLWAAFSSASAAVNCAVHIQQDLERRYRHDADRPRVRIGVSAGESTIDDGDYFGMPSIEAARLCDRADADGVLVSPAVRLLAGRCEGVGFESQGAVELKGLDPMEAFALTWEPLPDAGPDDGEQPPAPIPLPGPLAVPPAVEFVGRTAERGALDEALSAAAAGVRRIVLVSGEAGMGKTRLLTDFARDAHADGALVLYGRCEEGLAVPYRPWVELLGHLVEHAGSTELSAVAETDLAELGRLVPSLRSRIQALAAPSGSIADKYLLFGAVARLVTAVAGDRTVVVMLDDLHWADQESLQLLQHVVASWARSPVAVVGTYRDTDVDAGHPLTEVAAQLHREDGMAALSMKGLSSEEVTDLLEVIAGHSIDEGGAALADALWSETAGSPFFLVEVVRHLTEAGTLARDEAGRWSATVELGEIELPISVRAVVGQRVRRLGESAGQVLTAAAVVGREFEGALVAQVLGIGDDAVLEALERAVGAGLVAETDVVDRFTFTHALVQHTLYHELSMTRRTRLHLAVADVIESLTGGDPDERAGELANHLFAATQPAQQDRAIRLALQAGERATRAAAPEEAVRWYTLALEAHGLEDDLGADILLRLGRAEFLAGRATYRERLLEAARVARACGAVTTYVAAAIANFRGLHSSAGAVDQERVQVIETALELVGPADSPDRARLLASLAGELAYAGDDRRFDLCREAREIAARLGDRTVLLDAMLRTGLAMNTPTLYAERRARTEEMLRLSAESGDPFQRFFAIEMHADSHLWAGEIEALHALDDERQAIAASLEIPTLTWMATNASALLNIVAGDLETGERLANEAFGIGAETGQPDLMVYFGSQLMAIRLVQNRGAELVPLLEQAIADNPGLPVYQSVLALCLARDGRHDEGAERFAPLRDAGFPFQEDVVWLTGHVVAAEAAAELGDREAAAVLYQRLLPFASLVACTRASCQGSTSYYLGRLAEVLGLPETEAHLRTALEVSQRLGSPYDIARTEIALARAVRDRAPEEAQQRAEHALTLGQRHGMALVTERAHEVLTG